MKEKGVLLPIFSLPSKYGIGDFGYEAYEFIDILSENNITYWEILPINASEGMPYSPISYYAFNKDYISIDRLKDYGLLDNVEELPAIDRVVYGEFKDKYYKEAFTKFKPRERYYKFIEMPEMQEYAKFSSKNYGESEEYYLFLQYILYKQWLDLRNYANSRNVKIIGDMPVYPVFNSVETKYHPECFEMKDGKFTFESGTPPDYFNINGQKWNSPVYDVENLRKQNYSYLINRFKYFYKLFDKVRIDYFRGYDSFFKIPIGQSGKEGFYSPGVSYEFFDELFESTEINPDNFIIEDLGDIREETRKLRDYYHFTRQKILQYTIDLDSFTDRDDESYNVLAFPGNHDCHTLYGWYKTLDDEYKWKFQEFLRRHECYDININIGMMQYLMKCKARIAIITVQDVLGLDDSARINIPGLVSSLNWSWKLKDFNDFRREIKHFN